MSVGAELLIRAIVDAMDEAVLFSEFGDGCPLLEASAHPPIRLARRPVGGIIRRAGLSTFAPPLDTTHRRDDCARLMKGRRVIIDAIASNAAELIESANELAPDALAVLRVRDQGYAPVSLKLIYESRSGADQIYLRRDLITNDLMAHANALAAAEIDEFDALRDAIGNGVITTLRHDAGLSEAIFDPASQLDQADARQIAAALGGGLAIMAEDGGCSLHIPQLSGAPMPVTAVIGGLELGAADPTASLPNAPHWTLETRRTANALRISARPGPGAAPLVSIFLDIQAPDSPEAQVTEVASAITRTRGAWEIWDEAQQQLELEESW